MRIIGSILLIVLVSLAAAGSVPSRTFRDAQCGIEFLYPASARISRPAAGIVRIDLPFASGTTLREKYLLIEPAAPGDDPAGGIEVGGVRLWFECGSDGAVGSVYDYIRCIVTLADGRRAVITFVIHSVNPGMFDLPPSRFDRAMETLPFWGIIASLRPLQ